jgi:hypothetical protein
MKMKNKTETSTKIIIRTADVYKLGQFYRPPILGLTHKDVSVVDSPLLANSQVDLS